MNRGGPNNDDICGKLFFNKYKPEKKLGEGSFGKIYSAFNVTNCEQYALKMVN
jgi:serine/threonine protein kinase